jgi:uncharacterized membrane-anchored protein YjiN (DUF445 family)
MSFSNKRVIANQCLLVALVLYVISAVLIGTYPSLGYLKAFAEAAIVGGIADWFAVTALFKHPLGLKIPHTAIIPNSKSKIGKNLSHFIRENFLSEKYVKENLRKIDLHEKGAVLLRANQAALTNKVNETVFKYINAIQYKDVEKFIFPLIKTKIDGFDVNVALVKFFEMIDNRNYHHTAFLAILEQLNIWLSNTENETMVNDQIKELIRKDEDGKNTFTGLLKSMFIGEPKLHKYLTDFIHHIKTDPDKKVIERVDNFFEDIIERMRTDKKVRESIVEFKNQIIDSIPLEQHTESLFNEIKKWLINDFHKVDSFIKKKINDSIDVMITEIETSKPIKRWVKRQIEGRVPAFIAENADLIDNYFVQYLENLDTKQMSALIEEKVGEDLQYIRINGTVIGGLIGVLLYTATEIISVISRHIIG